jgi:tRNA/rRNA methyltransferase
VLQNFGQRELRLVAPAAKLDEQARRMAVDAMPLLEGARQYPTLQEATADLQWVVATASLRGRGETEAVPARAAVLDAARRQPNRTGFVFGPEDSGLTENDLAHCDAVAKIPASESHPTLNLAQAVAIVAYECTAAAAPAGPCRELATNESVTGAIGHLGEALQAIGFLNEESPDKMLHELRRILSRAQPSERDIVVLRGICRQILWAADASSRAGGSKTDG